jgi:hypothetical protein
MDLLNMKKITSFIFVIILFAFTNIYADIDTSKLNDYSSPKTSGQNINVNNKNLNTGSLQRTTIYPNGDMEGINQLGQHWTYTKSTSTYYNTTTGRTCKGTGGPSTNCNK